MEKMNSRNVPSNSYPSGAAASMTMNDSSDANGKWCLVALLFIVSFVLTIVVNKFWEWPLFFWTLSIALTIDFTWASTISKSRKFNCGDCGYLRCAERGKVRQLKFCTKWSLKPFQHFRLILWTIFFGIVTLIFVISNNFAAKVFTLIFWVFGVSVVGVLWIDTLRFGSTPHAYLSMPNHPPSCRCRGTGHCPNCSWPGTCDTCNGTSLCPTELEKVAPELLKQRNDLISYAFIFIIIGYVVFGLLLDYIYVYGGYI